MQTYPWFSTGPRLMHVFKETAIKYIFYRRHVWLEASDAVWRKNVCVIIVLCLCLIKCRISEHANESHTIYFSWCLSSSFPLRIVFFKNMKYHLHLLLISQIFEAALCLSQSDRVDWQMFDTSINPHLSMSNGTWVESRLSCPFTDRSYSWTHTHTHTSQK